MFGLSLLALALVVSEPTPSPFGPLSFGHSPLFASQGGEQAVQVGRHLVLKDVLEEPAVKDQLERMRRTGAEVFPAVGRLFQEKGETYELTLFLFVRDAGYFYRCAYLKVGAKATPVLVMALPGGLKDLGLERLVKP